VGTDSALRFAVLGDSIAYGQGAARASETAGARLAAELEAAGIGTELRIFAVPGARSDALAAQVRRAIIWAADLALIIIGANDLTRLVPPEQAAAQLGAAVGGLRQAGADVVVAPAPDLSAVPWVPPQLRAVVKAGSDLLRAAQTRAALAAGAQVADVGGSTTAAFATDTALFSSDRFHPSSAGYALIAQVLAPVVLAAAKGRAG
jgi:lysophospholipase L1-like esterase